MSDLPKIVFRINILVICTMMLIFKPASANANPEVRKVMAELAKDIQQFLKDNRTDSLVIRSFTGTGTEKTAAGLAFSVLLKEELEKIKVKVVDSAKYALEGTYFLGPKEPTPGKPLAVMIDVEFVDDFGGRSKLKLNKEISEPRRIEGLTTLVSTFAPTVPIPPKNTMKELDEKFREILVEKKVPTPYLDGSKISSSKGQPFAIEILTHNKPLPVHLRDNRAYVDVKLGESYSVRVLNAASYEVAEQLHIDGFSMFSLYEHKQPGEDPPFNVILVPAAKGEGKPGVLDIPGWLINLEPNGFRQFIVTDFDKSVAKQLKLANPDTVGTITAIFQRSWEGDKIPDDEQKVDPRGKDTRGPETGTGKGPPVGSGAVAVQRHLGVERDSISVRYTKPQPPK